MRKENVGWVLGLFLLVTIAVGLLTAHVKVLDNRRRESESNLSTLANPDSQTCDFCDRVIFEEHTIQLACLYPTTVVETGTAVEHLLLDNKRPGDRDRAGFGFEDERFTICTPCFSKGLSYLAPLFYEKVGEEEQDVVFDGSGTILHGEKMEYIVEGGADIIEQKTTWHFDEVDSFQYKGKEYKDFGELVRGIVEVSDLIRAN